MPLFPPTSSRLTRRPSAAPRGRAGGPVEPPAPAGTAAAALLKRYRPLETRATGGFGSVEICLDARLQRRVAIKRMPLASHLDQAAAETTAAALAEARTASMLQHPNIVQVIDFTYDEAYAYLVMEYVDGMNLEEFLAQVDGHSLTYDETACIADALAQALAYAHENGVLHLDIKPANVLIDRNGHIKLADFGMATLASAAGFGGARGGTIGYMPPEQLSGFEVDERADIFALAAVLYEALCARAPFRAPTPAESLAHIEAGVTAPGELLPDVPAASEHALIQALAPHAEDRMTSVDAFADPFLSRLGHAREGCRSLARLIARFTSDEGEADPADEDDAAEAVVELDPAEGWLGSRWPQARRWAAGALGATSVGLVAWDMLGSLQVTDPVARLAAAAGIGAAAGAAPQIGSALALTGFLMLIVNSTPLVAGIPTVVATLALAGAWWYVWGRLEPGASLAFVAAAATACTTGSAQAAAPVAAACAGLLLAPPTAVVSCAAGTLFAALLAAARASAGALPVGAAVAAIVQPAVLASLALGCAAAYGASWLLSRAWLSYLDEREPRVFVALAGACPAAAAVGSVLLARPMEIAGVSSVELATAGGVGCLSSIIVWICAFALGYRKEQAEGDRL